MDRSGRVVRDFVDLRAGQGGYNEDDEFYSYRMPIECSVGPISTPVKAWPPPPLPSPSILAGLALYDDKLLIVAGGNSRKPTACR
jgi:hypothetical protein